MLKDLQLKNVIFLAIPKDVQSTGYAFSHPRVKKYIISKHDILSVFVWLIFVYFGLDPEDPDSGSAFPCADPHPDPTDPNQCGSMRIRIRNAGYLH